MQRAEPMTGRRCSPTASVRSFCSVRSTPGSRCWSGCRSFMGELALVSAFMPRDWHVHEMLYGYLPAVITGFLFTAIPNWTGRLPLQGAPLMFLVAALDCGPHCGHVFGPDRLACRPMLVDCSFLLLVAAAAAREIIAGRNWSNLRVVIADRRPAGRQCRVSSRSAFRRRGRIQHPRRHRGRRDADLADRRTHHSELHPQLAGPAKIPAACRCRSPASTC